MSCKGSACRYKTCAGVASNSNRRLTRDNEEFSYACTITTRWERDNQKAAVGGGRLMAENMFPTQNVHRPKMSPTPDHLMKTTITNLYHRYPLKIFTWRSSMGHGGACIPGIYGKIMCIPLLLSTQMFSVVSPEPTKRSSWIIEVFSTILKAPVATSTTQYAHVSRQPDRYIRQLPNKK
jgi:hypothetical protein